MTTNVDHENSMESLDPRFEAALVENRRHFLNFLVRRLGSKQEAEDVLQEFYLRALRKAYAIRKSESIVAWLYRVLNSTLSDHRRKDRRRTQHEAAYAREYTTHGKVFDEEAHGAVCECMYRLLPILRPEYSDLLWRADLLGESKQVIAKDAGVTINNLTVRLHRARQALKRVLLRSCETCPEHGFHKCACRLPIRRVAPRAAARRKRI